MNFLDVINTCKACRFNDGTVYLSNPPKYKCTFDGEFHDELHTCHLDLAPVVRCKDCKYGELDDIDIPSQYLCRYDGESWNDENHFCSCGEKKGDDQ